MASSAQLLLLEHLNLTVADKSLAVAFYVDGLGCSLNSVVGGEAITHVNFGLSQFHLPRSTTPTTAQTWDGTIFLQTIEPLSVLQQRIVEHPVLQAHGGVSATQAASGDGDSGEASLLVTGPYGNEFHITSVPTLRHHFEVLGHHHGFSSKVAAMPKVVHRCHPGTARACVAWCVRACACVCVHVVWCGVVCCAVVRWGRTLTDTTRCHHRSQVHVCL